MKRPTTIFAALALLATALRRLRRLLRQLEDAHVTLLRALSDAGKIPERDN